MRCVQHYNGRNRRKPVISGHRYGFIFSPVYRDKNGEKYQYIRHMPSHYNDAKSEQQMVERNDMQRVMELHKVLRDAYQGCFEGKGKSYNRFISANRLSTPDRIIISKGSLPTLNYTIENDHINVEINEEDWQEGDFLRQVRATIDGIEYLAVIHMRPTENGYLTSTQEMVPIMQVEILEEEALSSALSFILPLMLCTQTTSYHRYYAKKQIPRNRQPLLTALHLVNTCFFEKSE